MKRIAATLGLVVATSLCANAADLPMRPTPVYIPPPPPPMWTGPFVGIFGGGSFGDDPGNSTGDKVLVCVTSGCNSRPTDYGWFGGPGATSSSSKTKSSFAGGAQIGYNFQVNQNFLFGGVLDFTWLKRSGSRYAESGIAAFNNGSEQSFYYDRFKQNWLGTARLKAGFVADNLLIYATGGLAFGHLKSSAGSETYWYTAGPTETLVASGYGSSSSTAVGWTAGAGLEYRMAPNWSLFAEYLYYSLHDRYNVTVTPTPGQTGATGSHTYRVKADGSGHLVKLGLNYLFWTPPPPPPPVVVSVRH